MSEKKRPQAKYKIDRRLGVNLWGRPKSPFNTRQSSPGQHGMRRGKLSDYGVQLQAKQKLKGYYANIGEKKFRKYYKDANRMKGDTGQNLIGLLERRLDAVIYRAMFVPTMFAARQFINHKHILVNGKCVNIPSYVVKEGDVIEIKTESREIPMILESIVSAEREVPDYVDVSDKGYKATFLRVPTLEEVPYAAHIEPSLIVEYYSR